jgi:two-component system, OmpR family, sensor kinase
MNYRRLWLTSIKYRLMLLFFWITAGAILIIYFYVVPQLQSNLTSQKVDDLKHDAVSYSQPLQGAIQREVTVRELDLLTRAVAEQSGAGVTLLGVPRAALTPSGTGGSPPYVISDSRQAKAKLQPNADNVLEAVRGGHLHTTTKAQNGQRLAQAAQPLFYGGQPAWVVVFSKPLDDVASNVALIRRQILVAGLIALFVALVSGYYAANALSRRVKRLERAAGEVAAGNFSDPIPVDSQDELGQLAQAFNEMQRRLARLDEARKEFIANASHELRTPIFSLGGFVELLEDEEVDEQTRAEFLTTMREQVARLQKLTTNLLDLSRLDAGSLELELEPVPLAMLAHRIAREFGAAASRHDARIEVAAENGRDVEAECDSQRVAQIVRALLDNALTHTEGGTEVEITVGTRRPSNDGRSVAELLVTDNGGGISKDDVRHVFERFHTGSSGGGSGLGLAIARELAERMSGKLEVTSEPGRTTFALTLPLTRESSGPAGSTARRQEAAGSTTASAA